MSRNPLLTLLTVPMLTSSAVAMLLMVGQAEATEVNTTIAASCSAPVQPATEFTGVSSDAQGEVKIASATAGTVAETGFDEDSLMDFTAAESDAAVALFGCDCPPCINALRQLQRQSLSSQVLLSSNQGHCWSAMERRISPQEAESVLQELNGATN